MLAIKPQQKSAKSDKNQENREKMCLICIVYIGQKVYQIDFEKLNKKCHRNQKICIKDELNSLVLLIQSSCLQ